NAKVEVIVKAKDSTKADFSHSFNEFNRDHIISIFGLYPDHNNVVYLNYYNQNNDLVDQQIHLIATDPINFVPPTIDVDIANTAAMEPGMTLVSYKAALNPNVPFI